MYGEHSLQEKFGGGRSRSQEQDAIFEKFVKEEHPHLSELVTTKFTTETVDETVDKSITINYASVCKTFEMKWVSGAVWCCVRLW
jgi:hypothetical protein